MTDAASHSVPEKRGFRRAFAVVVAFLQSMESTNVDHTLDRIERLERQVRRLEEEVRQGRHSGAVDARAANADIHLLVHSPTDGAFLGSP